MYKMVAIDLDDTLLTDNHEISREDARPYQIFSEGSGGMPGFRQKLQFDKSMLSTLGSGILPEASTEHI